MGSSIKKTVEIITSEDHPILTQYKSMKFSFKGDSNFFIADSPEVVRKLLLSDIQIESILAKKDFFQNNKINQDIKCYSPDENLETSIIGAGFHKGVMARAKTPIDKRIEQLQGPILCLDGIAKADNVGAIVRNATGFDVNNILISPDTCHPYNRRSVRVSMGNVFKTNIARANELSSDLEKLKALGYKIYGLENRPSATQINSASFNDKCILVIGSEGHGIRPDILEVIDELLVIPMNNEVYAFNAACASAIALYQFKMSLK